MTHIILTVVGYLGLNLAIWLSLGEGGLVMIAFSNMLGALITFIRFRTEVDSQQREIKWLPALSGSLGILLIVYGLRSSHAHLPVSLSIEAVYNTFATLTWPMFVFLHWVAPKHFSDRPNTLDIFCHVLMFGMVVLRFATYSGFEPSENIWVVFIPVCGYMLFNISIKLSGGHRMTNIAMNIGGGVLLLLMAGKTGELRASSFTPQYVAALTIGALSIYTVVSRLGASYKHFIGRGQASLVAPLVYDGILVASPAIMYFTDEAQHFTRWTIVVALGMLVITAIRYFGHQRSLVSSAAAKPQEET